MTSPGQEIWWMTSKARNTFEELLMRAGSVLPHLMNGMTGILSVWSQHVGHSAQRGSASGREKQLVIGDNLWIWIIHDTILTSLHQQWGSWKARLVQALLEKPSFTIEWVFFLSPALGQVQNWLKTYLKKFQLVLLASTRFSSLSV